MGCFLACFGSVEGKRKKPKSKTLPRDWSRGNYESLQTTYPLKEIKLEAEEGSLQDPESRDKHEDLSLSNRKKVTFDLNVKTYAEVLIQEVPNNSIEVDCKDKEKDKEDKNTEKQSSPLSLSVENSTPSSTGSYPANHRYQNCITSDNEEEEEAEYDDSDFDDGDNDDNGEEEESFESYFSLPMETEREISSNPVAEEEVEDSNSRPICGSPDRKSNFLANGARDRSQYVHSVLNPVENISQWKAVKAKTPPLKHQKENIELEQQLHIPFSSEPTFKTPKPKISAGTYPSFNASNQPPKQEISVDTSLSNWLITSETTPGSKTSIAESESSEKSTSRRSNSSINMDDRPILGALTVEELKQWSVTSSPRRSPSRSPDDIPILGTVGSYWNHKNQAVGSGSPHMSGSDSKGIPNTTSKYGEVLRV
ncbi:uncharacterized protein LOC143889182 isoform X2 [Tasmannia lanceolata]|uniref:uncharacterized protein LOC143889182 isoform X2 n=1 Tax=Tasmannia lanceolata TaxID=3420 RepID=UPI00406294BF